MRRIFNRLFRIQLRPCGATSDSLQVVLADQIRLLELPGLYDHYRPHLDHVQECRLQIIFDLLFHIDRHERSSVRLDINPSEQRKLAWICIRYVESMVFNDTTCQSMPTLVAIWKRGILALKILVLIAEQPFLEVHSRETLNMIHKSLITDLKLPLFTDDEIIRPMGLKAYCLARDSFKRILTPQDAHNLIRDVVLPATIWCLNEETASNANLSRDFYLDFHGSLARDNSILELVMPFPDKYKRSYPLLIQLLLRLAEHSTTCLSGGYINKFQAMLKSARSSKITTDEHIVALCVLGARIYSMTKKGPINSQCQLQIKYLANIMKDLLIKSDGLHRVHIAYMLCKQQQDYICMVPYDQKSLVMRTIIDDLITKDDGRLVEVVFNSSIQYNEIFKLNWSKLMVGKEIRILKRLVEIGAPPNMFSALLELIDCIKDDRLSLKFDKLAQMPISRAINKLNYLMKLNERDAYQRQQLEVYCKCLQNLLRLHRHRLEQYNEVRLNEVIDLSLSKKLIDFRQMDYGTLLISANSFKVHPSAWNSISKLIKFHLADFGYLSLLGTIPQWPAMDCDKDCYSQYLYNIDVINKTLPHLLLTDANYFYGQFATPETIKLVYNYCKHAIDQSFFKTLLKEILLTWPREVEKTKLGLVEYRKMLNKFIKLLINSLENANQKVGTPQGGAREIYVLVDHLSGLVVAYSHHCEALNGALDELGLHKTVILRNAWLKDRISTWTRLMIDSANPEGSTSRVGLLELSSKLDGHGNASFVLEDFSDLVVAHEGLKMIRRNSLACDELTKSANALLNVIKAVLDRNLARASIGSLERKRYLKIKASLKRSGKNKNQAKLVSSGNN